MKIAVFEGRLLVSCVLSVGIFAQAASAQDMSQNGAALNGVVTASHSGFGSGPLMVSLLGSPQLAAPIRGLETAPAPVTPIRDTIATTAAPGAHTGAHSSGHVIDVAFAR
jgi:hypothetical protein